MEPLRVLCVHGVGDHHSDTTWQADWTRAITQSIARFNAGRLVLVDFLMYDSIFMQKKYQIGLDDIASAVVKLSLSGIVHGIGDLLRRGRGIGDVPSRVRWTAGMVVQWADEPGLRQESRDALLTKMNEFQPNLLCAHSLGSLVTYDTLVRGAGPQLARDLGLRLATFGSQIGNPFVRNTFGGRIVPLAVDFWYHLFNKHDDVLAAEVRLPPQRFVQIETEFDLPGVGDHDAIAYLTHARAVDRMWREVAQPAAVPPPIARTFQARRQRADKPKRRALLVGINDYPNPDDRLEGCVNDVFTVSALLQEMDFPPEDIRVVLNDRATKAGIMERLQWLLSGVADDPNDQRFFFYSGHGAQIPVYGEGDQTDHLDECLVPYDFDWTTERAFTDDEFFDLYSQLPYGARFVAMFDCCHSGGMTRDGGAKVRGLAPPDDIRHRALYWDTDEDMWRERDLADAGRPLSVDPALRTAYAGRSRAKHRLGRAVPLRRLSEKEYDAEHKATRQAAAKAAAAESGNNWGPFMPVLIQACEEGELAYEYRHGVTAHGAFTFLLDRLLREAGAAELSFEQLTRRVTTKLQKLGYEQTPCLVGPRSLVKQPIPFAKPVRRPRASNRPLE
jgi:hypothetical protein